MLGLCVIVLIPASARATSVRALDFQTLTKNADVIAHGQVVALASQWASDRNAIETVVTVLVSDYLKGDLGAQIVFRVPGGKIGRLRSITAGAPVFEEGEDVIVFLASSGPAFPRIVGFNQGVFRVRLDESSGARLVASPLLAGEVTTATPLVRGDPSRKAVSLQQFQARVQSALQEARSARPAGNATIVGKAAKRIR
jgi:hypothetical protein